MSTSAPSLSQAKNLPGSDVFDGPAAEMESKPSRIKWGWILVILALGLGAGTWYYLVKRAGAGSVQFRTADVTKGDIVQEVTANGNINPVKQVQVGAQDSGIIQKIFVDYNAHVKANQIIAKIDPSSYEKNLSQAKAQLAVAQAALELADLSYRRAKELFKAQLISASDYDTAVATFHQAQATVQINEAAVERAKVDLGYTDIRAPIDGVVIERAVDEGQTVASSFSTPKLFEIANDLTKMQIEAAVSEADVGGVAEGQRVNFSVDAFPNRTFYGKVQQVRFDPITNQNVVTYTAVVQVDNPDLKLRPGMTATAKIVTAEAKESLRVPNAALRFHPPPGVVVQSSAGPGGATNAKPAVATDEAGNPIPPWRAEGRRPNPGEREKWEASLTPEQKEKFQRMMQQMMQRRAEGGGPGGMGPGGPPRPKPSDGPTTATVYLMLPSVAKSDASTPVLKAVTVKAGITDGTYTQILEGSLKEGDVVVTSVSTATTEAQQTVNPFSPFGRRR